MELNKDEKERFLKAKDKVRKIKIFYLHLVLYVIVVALISYNFYILEGPYKDNITAVNMSTLVFWTVFIVIHGMGVFKGRFLFKKSWEDKKIEEILNKKNKEETTFWE